MRDIFEISTKAYGHSRDPEISRVGEVILLRYTNHLRLPRSAKGSVAACWFSVFISIFAYYYF